MVDLSKPVASKYDWAQDKWVPGYMCTEQEAMERAGVQQSRALLENNRLYEFYALLGFRRLNPHIEWGIRHPEA